MYERRMKNLQKDLIKLNKKNASLEFQIEELKKENSQGFLQKQVKKFHKEKKNKKKNNELEHYQKKFFKIQKENKDLRNMIAKFKKKSGVLLVPDV